MYINQMDKLDLQELNKLNNYLTDIQELIWILCIFCGISVVIFGICMGVYVYNHRKTDKKIDNLLAYHALEDKNNPYL